MIALNKIFSSLFTKFLSEKTKEKSEKSLMGQDNLSARDNPIQIFAPN